MDHEAAVQQKAAESYLLGELTGKQRDEFEEHFFLCPQCAEDVEALTVMAANARAVFREESVPAGLLMSRRIFWMSAALNLALIAGLGYVLVGVTPEMKRELAEAEEPQFVQDVPVLAVSRGGEVVREIASTTRRVVFSFYLKEPFTSISYEITDGNKVVIPRRRVSAPPREESAESHFSISTEGLKPDIYEIRFWGQNEHGETPIGQSKFKILPAR